MEECELVTHGHRHGDCLPGSVGGVSYGNGARSTVHTLAIETGLKNLSIQFLKPARQGRNLSIYLGF